MTYPNDDAQGVGIITVYIYISADINLLTTSLTIQG